MKRKQRRPSNTPGTGRLTLSDSRLHPPVHGIGEFLQSPWLLGLFLVLATIVAS